MKKILSLLLVSCYCVSAQADFVIGEQAYVAKNWNTAYNEFKPLADSGDFRSQYYLGLLHLYGFGTEKDEKKAVKYLTSAADQNYDMAQAMLGYLYSEGVAVKKNKRKGMALYEAAAAQNNSDALLNLGVAYYTGDGATKNVETAVNYFLKISPQQKPIVAKYLGDIYLNEPSIKDTAKAFSYYSTAASAGNISAYHNLGYMYQNGLNEAKNIELAIKYYAYAASKGYTPSLYALGVIYANGEGVTRDVYKAHAYFSLAAAKKMPEAIKAKQLLEENMSLSEQDKAGKAMIQLQQDSATVASPVEKETTTVSSKKSETIKRRTTIRRRRR
ncbi:MAG: sel1 repeat family protein [Alphaproteobacteria bacterium]|nr:sel1 repeat family protein [Alphaproteobacteria bacterium]